MNYITFLSVLVLCTSYVFCQGDDTDFDNECMHLSKEKCEVTCECAFCYESDSCIYWDELHSCNGEFNTTHGSEQCHQESMTALWITLGIFGVFILIGAIVVISMCIADRYRRRNHISLDEF
jgi:hypothetical protein